MTISNKYNVPLPMAAWLVTSNYDYIDDPSYISATSLLKSTRQIILSKRVETKREVDVQDLAASVLGSAMHDSIEHVWTDDKYIQAMKILGYPQNYIDSIVINPTEVNKGEIPVYLEQRNVKNFCGWKIGGKFDVIFDGQLQDYKSTSTYTYINQSKNEDYSIQGSIYRWLNQDKVTDDVMLINFYFTNWTKADQEQHGITRVMGMNIPLKSIAETEQWIKSKLDEISANIDLPEPRIKECTPEELWMTPTVYKYYSNPEKTDGRATKNFESLYEANSYIQEKNKGVVITVPGVAKACKFCPAFEICTQKDKLNHD